MTAFRWKFPFHPALIRPRMLVLLLVVFAAGCAQKLSGDWEAVQVSPPGASFPFNRVQFDPAGKYTATGLYDGHGRMTDEVRTTTGDFRQSGGKLQILPHKGDAQAYRIRRRLDGKMEVILDVSDQKESVRAVFAPSNP